jgi:coenzyme F420-dependent glucose-6-phosphate dehydrogenase
LYKVKPGPALERLACANDGYNGSCRLAAREPRRIRVISLGYKLSSEEHSPRDLVAYARRAEDSGFDFASISDHFHPWTDRQGQSPFVWSVLGAISQATERIELVTGVTCPTVRIHPAIVAQAAATTAAMMPGRFALGVGSGENLNEHILGDAWPSVVTRLEMLAEAIEVMRGLWDGRLMSHRGTHYRVENARIYTLPDDPIPIYVAGSGEKSVELAGRLGDGFIGLAPDSDMLEGFDSAGGSGKPKYCEVNVCWAESKDGARETVRRYWPVAGVQGQLMQELALPAHFEQAAEPIPTDAIVASVVCGPDPDEHIETIRRFEAAGYDHIWLHQIGPDQRGFFDFYESSVAPKL